MPACQHAAAATMLGIQRIEIVPRLLHGGFEIAHRFAGHDGVAQRLVGVVAAIRRHVEWLARRFSRREKLVALSLQLRLHMGQRGHARGTCRQRFRKTTTGIEQVLAALAQRLRGEAEFAAEIFTRQTAKQRRQRVGRQRLFVDVDQCVLLAPAAAHRDQPAVGMTECAADAQFSTFVKKTVFDATRIKPEQQVADRDQRRGLAAFVGAEHHMQRGIRAKR